MDKTTEEVSVLERAGNVLLKHKEWLGSALAFVGGAEIGASWIKAAQAGYSTVLAGGVENIVNFVAEAGVKLSQMNLQGVVEAMWQHPTEAAAVASAVAALAFYVGGAIGFASGVSLAEMKSEKK